MVKIILTLSLVACNSKSETPDDDPKDTTAKVDTIEDSESNTLEIPDISINDYDFPERCTTITENRDHHIAPKEKELRPKICNLTGIDQTGRENNLYDFEGDVIVLVILNTVCDECRDWLNNDGLWASPGDVARLHTDHSLSNYPVLAVDPRVIGEGSQQFKPYRNDHYFPMFYIIDKNMRIAWSSTGQPWHDSFHSWTEWHLPVQDLTLE